MVEHLSVAPQDEETGHGNVDSMWNVLFAVDVLFLSEGVQEDVSKFVNDSTARDAFESGTLPNCNSKISESYPYVTEVPTRVLLMFPSACLCEQGFSSMFCM